MTGKPVPDEVLQQTVNAIAEHGSVSGAARATQTPEKTVRSRRDMADRRGITADIPEDQALKGTSTLYDDKGNVRLQWVKTKEDNDRYEARIRAMIKEMAADLPKLKKRTKQDIRIEKDLLNIINYGDPHIGAYIWDEECNGQNFDLDIAKRDLCGATAHLVDAGPASHTMILAPLGDFYHADTATHTTTKGTQLDLDTRMPKVIRTGVAIIRQCIETGLDRHKQVRVVVTPGNHDQILSQALAVMLDHIYEKEPRVVVDNSPAQRHYFRWGNTLIGWVHGDKTKDQSLALLMATERAEDWGQTTHRYFYRGHKHTKTVYGTQEVNGCIIEGFRTLCPSDAYATGLGLISGNDLTNITLHKDYGEVARATCSINLLRDMVK